MAPVSAAGRGGLGNRTGVADHGQGVDHAGRFVPGDVAEQFVGAGPQLAKVEFDEATGADVAAGHAQLAHPDVVRQAAAVLQAQGHLAGRDGQVPVVAVLSGGQVER